MVKGIDQFKTHFEGFNDRYVLIGGAACYLAMEEAGLDFRSLGLVMICFKIYKNCLNVEMCEMCRPDTYALTILLRCTRCIIEIDQRLVPKRWNQGEDLLISG